MSNDNKYNRLFSQKYNVVGTVSLSTKNDSLKAHSDYTKDKYQQKVLKN